MQPDNILMGDAMGIDLPQSTPDENSLNEEKNMARYSKSKEFKRIREWCQQRIDFYQSYLPDGTPVPLGRPLAEDWRIANAVIAELKSLMNSYDTAREIVEESVKNAR